MTTGHRRQISHCVAWASWQPLLHHSCGMWLVTEHTDHLLMLRVRLSVVPMTNFLDESNSWVLLGRERQRRLCAGFFLGSWQSPCPGEIPGCRGSSTMPMVARDNSHIVPHFRREGRYLYPARFQVPKKSISRWIDSPVSLPSVSLSAFARDLFVLHTFKYFSSPDMKFSIWKWVLAKVAKKLLR